jgi:hypothetical protein
MALQGDLGTLFYKLVLGDTEFNKSLDGADKKLEAFNKKLEKVGKELTTKLTLPILAVGAASLKFAADAEVASRKFDTAFQGSFQAAADAVKLLNEQYGLSNTQSKQLLANTGDLLKGFGATSEQALDTSLEVQKLAVALSAYNGVDVATASQKITKALLGETDGLVELGVKLTQTDVQQELVRRGQEKLEGQALLTAKASATLALVMQQSGDAISSVADNQSSLSFQTSALLGDMKDLAVEMGTQLLPIAKDIVGGIRDVAKWFGDLSTTTKQTIITIAALVAGIGPLVTGIGAVSTALTFLAANPVGAAIAAIAALTVGLVALNAVMNEKAIDNATERFGDLAKEIGVTGEQIVAIEKSLRGWTQVNADGVEAWSEKLGITEQQFLRVAIASEKVSDQYKESARVILAQLDAEEQIRKEAEERARLNAEAARAREEEARAAEAAAKAAEAEARARAEQTYIEGREKVVAIIQDSLTEQQRIQQQITELEALRWATGSAREADRLKAIQLLRDQIVALNERERQEAEETAARAAKLEQDKADTVAREAERAAEERMASINEVLRDFEAANTTELEALRAKYDEIAALDLTLESEKAAQAEALIALEQQIADETQRIKDEAAAEDDRRRKEEIDKEKQKTQKMIAAAETWSSRVMSLANSIAQIYRNLADRAIEQWDRQIERTNQYYDEAIARAEDAADKDGVRTEEEKQRIKDLQNAKLKAEYDANVQKYKIEKDAFRRSQAIAYAQIAINTALAIVKGYAELGPIGGTIAAVALGILGAAQAAVVYSQPQPTAPQPPKYLAKGGVVSATPGGVSAVIGEGGSDELVAPLTDKTFSMLGDAIVSSMTGSSTGANMASGLMNLTIVLDGLGEVALELTQEALNNGVIRVPARVIV